MPTKSVLIKFFKKETLAQVFSCEFCEIFKNTFNWTLPVAASGDLDLFSIRQVKLQSGIEEHVSVNLIKGLSLKCFTKGKKRRLWG